MVGLSKSIISRVQLLTILAIVASIGSASARSEKENFAYIKSILNLLNNNEHCLLPTYGEIDNLHTSVAELESTVGNEALENELGPDVILVKKNILEQWLPFQERMDPAIAIPIAKQRAFLHKIEAYQLDKFGSSICTEIKENRKSFSRDFEKNPVVEYVEHLEKGDEPELPVKHKNEKIVEQKPLVTTVAPTTELPIAKTRPVVIKYANMNEKMQHDAIMLARAALEKYEDQKERATYIKNTFDCWYGTTWHCMVGKDFGSYVTHFPYIEFKLGQVKIVLFKFG